MTVILDISRLISRIRHATPSGVDRVEMAYARGLLARYGDAWPLLRSIRWAAMAGAARGGAGLSRRTGTPLGQPRGCACAALAALGPAATAGALAHAQGIGEGIGNGAAIYVQASPHHLTKGRSSAASSRAKTRGSCASSTI
jgi:hypothetical protein